jgi:hypothetical protein
MSFNEANGIITQTGTDTDLSLLSGVTGVVVVDNGSHKTYHIDNKQLRINGTLTIDPQVECLLFERNILYISGTLNFGVTSVIGGATRYSRAIGLISYDDGYLRFRVRSGGTLNWNGGAMKLRGGCDFEDGSTVSITNGIIIATNSIGQRLRMNTADCSVDGLSIDGNIRFDVFKTFVKFERYNPSFTATGVIQKVGSSHSGTNDPFVLTDFDAQGIQSLNGDFIGSSFAGTKIEFVNMGFTGDFIITHDSTGGGSAVTTLYKDIKLKIVDANISNIAGAKYWATDKDNGDRFTGTASWRGSQNADETFSSDIVYTGSTNASGEATERLLTRTCYGGLSNGGVYNGNTTVDYRGETTDNTDVFNFYVASYEHTLNSTSPSCIGTGVLEQQVVLFSDVFLTESDKTIVDTYAEIDTPQRFYDRAKAYLVDFFAGETQTIVTRDGNIIDARGYNVEVDDQATDVFAFDGTTITIKASSFVGNIQTTGTITLSNNAEVIGSYGQNTVLPWEVTNVEATATLQLFNITKNLEVENLVVAGTAGNKVTSSGTYTGQEVSVGDNIRLRITCQAGTSAFLPYEAFGIATSVGISFEANQVTDTIYNDNGINADNLTTLSADYPNVEIDIDDGDGIADAREFYAFYVKQATTATGIEQWFGAIDAIDHMNYRVNTAVADIKLQNTGSTPLVISGARIFRDNGTSILHANVGDQPMTQDNGELIQYIKGQVDESLDTNLPPAIAGDATISGIDKNAKLIPALL